MSKTAKMRKQLLKALEAFKDCHSELLHIVAEHLELSEPNAAPIIQSVANFLDNEERV